MKTNPLATADMLDSTMIIDTFECGDIQRDLDFQSPYHEKYRFKEIILQYRNTG